MQDNKQKGQLWLRGYLNPKDFLFSSTYKFVCLGTSASGCQRLAGLALRNTNLGKNWKLPLAQDVYEDYQSHLQFTAVQHACVSSPIRFSLWQHSDSLLSKPLSIAGELPRICVPCQGGDMKCQYWDPAQPMLLS